MVLGVCHKEDMSELGKNIYREALDGTCFDLVITFLYAELVVVWNATYLVLSLLASWSSVLSAHPFHPL